MEIEISRRAVSSSWGLDWEIVACIERSDLPLSVELGVYCTFWRRSQQLKSRKSQSIPEY